jgi:hypothetical protein
MVKSQGSDKVGFVNNRLGEISAIEVMEGPGEGSHGKALAADSDMGNISVVGTLAEQAAK